jgi:transposase
VDSQSIRIAEESGFNKGYYAAKRVPGRKRRPLVDASGLLLAEKATPADISDNRGAREWLMGLAPLMPRLELVWADSAYAAKKLRGWRAEHTGWQVEVVPVTTITLHSVKN